MIGEKKLGKLVVPDVWKVGPRGAAGGKQIGTKINMSLKLEKKKFVYSIITD